MVRLKPESFCASNRKSGGFTLVEVLVAIAVSGILLSAVTALLLGSLNLQQVAVSEGGFAVRAQRLLNQMVDGTEGLIGASELLTVGDGIISYKVGSPAVTVTYQLSGDTITRTRNGVAAPVLIGVGSFLVEQTGSTLSLSIAPLNAAPGSTVYQTSVVPRNL